MISLMKLGISITSHWQDNNTSEDPLSNKSLCVDYAERDLEDIDNCDLFIYFSEPCTYGKNIELGYAIALDKAIIIIGPVLSVFHHYVCETHGVDIFNTADECITFLAKHKKVIETFI